MNEIIITDKKNKTKFLKDNSSNLHNYKIYTIEEFKEKLFYSYDKEALIYISNNYNVKPEIAKIYLENLYYIDNIEYQSSKLTFLKKLKKDLKDNNLIHENILFKKFIKDKKLTFLNLPSNKELELIKNKLNNVSTIDETNLNYEHEIVELNNIEDEVLYIANKICDLINKGIDIKNIYLTNLNDDYRKIIKRIFPMFNISYTLQDNINIYSTHLVQKFLELSNNDIDSAINELKEIVLTKEDEEILNIIINIINQYAFIDNKDNLKEFIKLDLKNTKLKNKNIINSVHEISLNDKIFTEDEYVFIPSFNQGIIPTIYKDEAYLSDKEKEILKLDLTVDKNIYEKNKVLKIIKNIKNAFITYKINANGEELYLSNINEELNYKIIKNEDYNYSYSNLYNKLKLSSLLDDYYKYGTESKLLHSLNNHYENLNYRSYSNIFTGINNDSLRTYLDNKLTLSYSSLDKYYRCPFSYYLNFVLKINKYEETFFQVVGSLFHAILEKIPEYDTSLFAETWEQELSKITYQFNPKEQFFLTKLKNELIFVINTIKEQNNFSNLTNELHEQMISIDVTKDTKIKFVGIIDKIKYQEIDGKCLVAIIDYKTGHPSIDLTTLPYGIGMQLPVYLYLANNTNKLKNIEIVGFYLQTIINNEVKIDKDHSYEQQKKKNLLLQGYSTDNIFYLKRFDSTYLDSNLIKSMKFNKDGSFSHYSYNKVLSEEKMNIILKKVDKMIKKGSINIMNGEFPIAPKKIGLENYGCSLCKFNDICYHTNKDIVELKELTLNEVFEEDSNGLD